MIHCTASTKWVFFMVKKKRTDYMMFELMSKEEMEKKFPSIPRSPFTFTCTFDELWEFHLKYSARRTLRQFAHGIDKELIKNARKKPAANK